MACDSRGFGDDVSAKLTDVSLTAALRRADPTSGPDFGAELAHRALTWHQQPGETAALQAITADIPGLLRGADAAAVAALSYSGELRITAAHGPTQLLQSALHRSLTPHRWTVQERSQLGSPANRWPVSATLDHDAQLGSMICAPLGSGQMMFGTLLILGFTLNAFSPNSATDATTLAIHASIALAAHRQQHHLQEAVGSRDIIGQAKGILMSTHKLTAEQAFASLATASQNSNIKLTQVAEILCMTGELVNPESPR